MEILVLARDKKGQGRTPPWGYSFHPPFLLKGMGFLIGIACFSLSPLFAGEKPQVLLHVSTDATRELYQELNGAFAQTYREKTGAVVRIEMSHGGSGKQARAVLDGLQADLISLSLDYDVQFLVRNQLVEERWQERMPRGSHPYAPVIVFLVRKGNPRGIHDWEDLLREGVKVITPNPKTSGGARWNYLAAYAYAKKRWQKEEAAQEFLKQLYGRVPVLDTGARGSTLTFVERGMGDVYITWENEALLITRTLRPGEFEIIYPSLTIRAECPATLVDAVVKRKGTRTVAEAYLHFLFSPEGQEIIARHGFRPTDPALLKKYAHDFPPVPALTLGELYKDWEEAHRIHFREGGVFDGILKGLH